MSEKLFENSIFSYFSKRKKGLNQFCNIFPNLSLERKGLLGQTTIISHSILIALGLLLILFVIITVSTIRTNYMEFMGGDEAGILCSLVKHSVEEMYFTSDYISQTDTMTGKIVLDLPQRLGDSVYRARFVNDTLLIETYGELKINATCAMGYDASYSGATPGGKTELRWTKTVSGGNIIELVKT